MYQAQLEEILEKEGFGAVFAALPKAPGDAITATISFRHQGPGESVIIWWWIAPGSSVPLVHKDINQAVFVTSKTVTVPTDASLTQRSYQLSGSWPSQLPDPGFGFTWEKTDCYIEVTRGTEVLLSGWWDDVYTTMPVEYEGLEASFQ